MTTANSGTIGMDSTQYERLRTIVSDRRGISLNPAKRCVLESRLGLRLAELTMSSYDEYIAFLTIGPHRDDELQEMLNRITINETLIIGNAPPLRAFGNDALSAPIVALDGALDWTIDEGSAQVMGTTITSGFPLTMEIMPATIERALCSDLGQELEGIGLVDPALISALIRSIRNVFSTMLQLPVEVGTPSIKTGNERPHDVSGIIGMSGEVVGLVALSFAGDAAERIVASFTGARTSLGSEDFRDAIGELVGMVAGGAKGMLDGREVAISCPSVIVGANYGVGRFEGAPCVVIPCSTDCGEVMIEVAIEGRKQPEPAAAGASGLGADRRHLTRTPGPTGLQESPR